MQMKRYPAFGCCIHDLHILESALVIEFSICRHVDNIILHDPLGLSGHGDLRRISESTRQPPGFNTRKALQKKALSCAEIKRRLNT
jgi:hypothetical protein